MTIAAIRWSQEIVDDDNECNVNSVNNDKDNNVDGDND